MNWGGQNMKSDRLSFNTAIARDTLRRCWPLWAGYLIYLIITLPVSLTSYIRMNSWVTDLVWFHQDLNSRVVSMGFEQARAAIVVGMLTVMVLFGYLYNSRGNTLMNSLPVRRESLFLTLYLTGLVPLLIIQGLIMLLTVAMTAGRGIEMQNYLIWFGCASMSLLFYYGFSCFCAMLTGNLIVLPVVYAVLNFTAFAVETCLKQSVQTLVYGMGPGSERFLFLSPFVYLENKLTIVTNHDYSFHVSGLPALGVYAFAGLVFSVLAVMLYRRRNMETVSDLVAFPILKPLFRICLSAGCACVFAALLFQNFFNQTVYGSSAAWLMGFLMVLGAVFGWVAAEMLIRRSVRVFPLPWKGLAAICACCILLVVIAETDLTGYERRIPDPDEVQCVRLSYDEGSFETPENIAAFEALHRELIEKKPYYDGGNEEYAAVMNRSRMLSSAVSPTLRNDGQDNNMPLQYYLPVIYELKNGSTLERYYTIWFQADEVDDPSSTIGKVVAILNSQEGIQSRMSGGGIPFEEKYVSYATIEMESATGGWDQYRLTPQEFLELWTKAMVPDAKEGNLCLYTLADTEQNLSTQTNLRIEVSMQDNQSGNGVNYWYHSFRVFTFSDRCLEWIENHTDLKWTTMHELRMEQNDWDKG